MYVGSTAETSGSHPHAPACAANSGMLALHTRQTALYMPSWSTTPPMPKKIGATTAVGPSDTPAFCARICIFTVAVRSAGTSRRASAACSSRRSASISLLTSCTRRGAPQREELERGDGHAQHERRERDARRPRQARREVRAREHLRHRPDREARVEAERSQVGPLEGQDGSGHVR
jgi:hypothetical protein